MSDWDASPPDSFEPARPSRLGGVAWSLSLVTLSLAARAPALANPDTTNSDAAIVGLQALHILRGERSQLLWGSHYQTSVDSFVAAGFFKVLGASLLTLMLSALALHIVLTLAVYFAASAVMGRARAFLVSLLLVCTGAAIHSYALYPPRQAGVTVAVLALVLLAVPHPTHPDGTPRTGDIGLLALLLGAMLAPAAIYADPYAVLFLPGAGMLALLAIVRGRDRSARVRRFAAMFLGVFCGMAPLVILSRHPNWRAGEVGLSRAVFPKNLGLLLDPCGPWAFGSHVYRPLAVMNYVPWNPASWVRTTQGIGAALLVLTIVVGPLLALSRRVPPGARVLGIVGGAVAYATFGGFLFSVMVMDHFSMRYLAAAIIVAPFCLAPFASLVRARVLAIVVLPMLVTGIIGGWASFGHAAEGARIAKLPGHDDELALLDELRQDGVTLGIADYWVSYRLTLLAKERVVVVPSHAAQDRYWKYRDRVASALRLAYIVDDLRSDEPADKVAVRLASTGRVRKTWRRGTMTLFELEGGGDVFGSVGSD